MALAGCGEGLYTRVSAHGDDGGAFEFEVARDVTPGAGDSGAGDHSLESDLGPPVEPRDSGAGSQPDSPVEPRDSGVESDEGPAVRLDAQITSVTMRVGPSKGVLEIPDEATLMIAAGVLPNPTVMTLRAAKDDRGGTIGPTFEVEAPAGTTFRGNPKLEIKFSPDPGIPPDHVRLAYLMRESGSGPLWVFIQESSYDPARKVLAGDAINIGHIGQWTIRFAPVRICGPQSSCPPLYQCTGGACQ